MGTADDPHVSVTAMRHSGSDGAAEEGSGCESHRHHTTSSSLVVDGHAEVGCTTGPGRVVARVVGRAKGCKTGSDHDAEQVEEKASGCRMRPGGVAEEVKGSGCKSGPWRGVVAEDLVRVCGMLRDRGAEAVMASGCWTGPSRGVVEGLVMESRDHVDEAVEMESDCTRNLAHVAERVMGNGCRNRRGGERRWIVAAACRRLISGGDEAVSANVTVCTSATVTSMTTPSGSRMETGCTTSTVADRADQAFATATGCRTVIVCTIDRAVESENARVTAPGRKTHPTSCRTSMTSSCCTS